MAEPHCHCTGTSLSLAQRHWHDGGPSRYYPRHKCDAARASIYYGGRIVEDRCQGTPLAARRPERLAAVRKQIQRSDAQKHISFRGGRVLQGKPGLVNAALIALLLVGEDAQSPWGSVK